MYSVSDNTVSAKNQINKNSEVFFLGSKNAKTKVLILGNSITRHGPKKDIGWINDWGMAASSREKDFVHLLYDKLIKNGYDVYFYVRQASFFEISFEKEGYLESFRDEHDFNADVVIYRLGENIPAPLHKEAYEREIRRFMSYVAPNAKVIFTTCFWNHKELDECNKVLADERGYTLCHIDSLGKDKSNMALGLFRHEGVAMHPGDKGMSEIADAIYKSYTELQ